MKKAKIMLVIAFTFAVLGGSLAFKANKAENFGLFQLHGDTCRAVTTLPVNTTILGLGTRYESAAAIENLVPTSLTQQTATALCTSTVFIGIE